MDREEVARKREAIREELRLSREEKKFRLGDTVEAAEAIKTDIKSLLINRGDKGKVVFVFKWVRGYDIEFKIHGHKITVSCMETQLRGLE